MISFLLLVWWCTPVLSLTTDDYYSDPGAMIVKSLTDSTVQSDLLDLPVAMSNLKKAGSDVIVSKYKLNDGKVELQNDGSYVYIDIKILYGKSTAGNAVIQVSNETSLIMRATKDIADNNGADIAAVTPTYLILFNIDNLKRSTSTKGSTYQIVLATNGQYSYLIIQFVSVEPAASNDAAEIVFNYFNTESLPYAKNILNAPLDSNIGVPGKYIIDLNEKPPPCNCKRRLVMLACETLKRSNDTLPKPCQDFE